jgi:TonB family protein
MVHWDGAGYTPSIARKPSFLSASDPWHNAAMHHRSSAKLAVAILSLLPGLPAVVAQTVQTSVSTKPPIVSPTHPTDSRGETVYESQGDDQKDRPIVPGIFTNPSAIKTPLPKYPKSLKKGRAPADVTVEGIAAADGDFIDAKVVDSTEPAASQSALDAVARYKFHPATLDGKPVAVLIKAVVHFRVF